MILSHGRKFIFIKTRKTAGTSIEIALSQYCQKNDTLTDLQPEDERQRSLNGAHGPQNNKIAWERLTLHDWLAMLTSLKGRPAYARHASAAFIKTHTDRHTWNTYFKFCFERNPFDRAISRYFWKTRDMNPRPDINTYILSNTPAMLSNWGKYTINDRIVVDFVGRYENLTEDLAKISSKLDLPGFSLPRAKGNTRTDRTHYSRVLNAETRRHIEKACAREIEQFHYFWVDQ